MSGSNIFSHMIKLYQNEGGKVGGHENRKESSEAEKGDKGVGGGRGKGRNRGRKVIEIMLCTYVNIPQ